MFILQVSVGKGYVAVKFSIYVMQIEIIVLLELVDMLVATTSKMNDPGKLHYYIVKEFLLHKLQY